MQSGILIMSNQLNPHENAASIRHDAENLADLFPTFLVEAEKLAHAVTIGYHGRKRAGQGENFWQHRPYTFGDAVSAIDWRQSARSADRLYIRQNEWEAAASVWIWRDPSSSMVYQSEAPLDKKIHRATILATALSILLSQAGERIGVLSENDGHNTTSRLFHGKGAPEKVIESLCHDHENTTSIIPVSEKMRAGNHLVLFSDFFMEPDQLAKTIDRNLALGVHGVLCQVLDPAELHFPFKGRTEFLDMESSSKLLFGNSGSLRSAYLDKFLEHQEHLKTLCIRAGWPFYSHTTDEPAQDALMFMLEMLSEKTTAPAPAL